MRGALAITACLLVAASCGDDGSSGPAASTTTAPDTGTTVVGEPSDAPGPTASETTVDVVDVVDVDDAIAINVTGNGSGDPVVAWSADDAVRVARLDLVSFALGTPIIASGDLLPVGHPIERPAVSVGDDDVVHVAFTSFVGAEGSVFYVDVIGDRPTDPVAISGTPRPETNLVHMTPNDEAPTLAWLEDSTLSVALPVDGTPHEIEDVDDLTCDCCNPVPIRLGDQLTVAYRDQVHTPDGTIRDVYAITSTDGGASFGEPVAVADDHWFLDGCPFSGPAVARVDDDLLVTWMDARQSLHPDQDGTTIWVDRSSDGGATWGTDLAITDGGIHRWSSLAVDDRGTVHLIWETQATDGGISYSSSSDGGRRFDPPVLLIPNTDDSGLRRAPSMYVQDDHLLVTWVDRTGGHLARFTLGSVSPIR